MGSRAGRGDICIVSVVYVFVWGVLVNLTILIRMMKKDPLSFKQGLYTIDHTSGLKIWVGNWIPFYGFYKPIVCSFGLIGVFRFWWAFKRWKRACITEQLKLSFKLDEKEN